MDKKAIQNNGLKEFYIPIIVFIIAAFVYGSYGFRGLLSISEATYAYAGQRLAEGIPPYISVFDHHTPLVAMLTGMGAVVSDLFHLDDIYTLRALFYIIGCLTVVAVYFLGKDLFQSKRAGLFSAMIFSGFIHFAQNSASGPHPKTPVVILITLSLLLTIRKKWFWAGLFGSLSFLAWQPTAIFAFVTFIVAIAQSGKGRERISAPVSVLMGILVPVVLVCSYFHFYGALYELLDCSFLFNMSHVQRNQGCLACTLRKITKQIGYMRSMTLPTIFGFVMILYIHFIYFVKRQSHIFSLKAPNREAFTPVILSFILITAWTLHDFQGMPDLYVFFPYLAAGIGILIEQFVRWIEEEAGKKGMRRITRIIAPALLLSLLMFSLSNARNYSDNILDDQREAAAAIEERFGKDVKVLSLNAPQVLVLLERTNPNRYVFSYSLIYSHINANVAGGLEGWIRTLEDFDPDVIAAGHGMTRSRNEFGIQLTKWLLSNYHEERLETWELQWKIYVKNSDN